MNRNDCIICGKPLVYAEKAAEMKCELCGKVFASDCSCEKGHYICDGCHGSGAMPVIKSICLRSESKNPYETALEIMNSPAVHMHGPEHHVIVGAALASAYKNAGGDIDLADILDTIELRGSRVPGGVCGNWGCCGAAVGTGIFLSAVTKTNPLSEETWGLCNRLTSECLGDIAAVGGPRCCKRNLGLAITRAVVFVADNLGVFMEKPEIACGFSEKNRECVKGRCPFNKGGAK